jgi:hypothetical protein
MALSLLGDERAQLTDVDTDNTKVSRQCLLHYDQTLEELTRLHTWNCASKRDELTTSDYTEFGWDKQATLPADCIRPIELSDTDTFYKTLVRDVEWEVSGRLVLSNYGDNFLKYYAVPAIASMDALFTRAFYTLLAVKIAIPITGDREIRRDLLIEFEQVIMPEARRTNSFEGFEYPKIDSEWLEATVTPTYGTSAWQALSVGDIPM